MSYKQQKEAFVTGHTGTTMFELAIAGLLFPASCFFYLSLRNSLSSLPTATFWPAFPLEFFCLVLPTILSMTLLADATTPLVIFLVALGSTLALLHPPTPSTPVAAPNDRTTAARATHITYFRSGIMLATCCAILAVDFPVFPRRFVKTEDYGQSLMDLGVGAFVVSGGLVSKMTRVSTTIASAVSLKTELLRVVPIFGLGLVRIAIVYGVDYQEHVSEYGVHWNFFFTLACLSMMTILFERTVWTFCFAPWVAKQSPRWPLLQPMLLGGLGLGVLAWHQYRISFGGIEAWVSSGEERRTLLDANKEGVTSTLGFFGLHLLATGWGCWERQRTQNNTKKDNKGSGQGVWHRRWYQYGTLAGVALAVGWLVSYGDGAIVGLRPSRKMANATYCLWVFVHNMGILVLLEEVVGCFGARGGVVAVLVTAINRNQLAVFLIGKGKGGGGGCGWWMVDGGGNVCLNAGS